MRLRFLSLALLYIPSIAFAEPFTVARDINLSVGLAHPGSAILQLDPQTRLDVHENARIIDSHGVAIPFDWINEPENLMHRAVLDTVPAAADTLPRTTIEMLRDGTQNTYFQPQTAQVLQLRFHFTEDVFPTALVYNVESGDVSNVRVRAGMSDTSLHDAYIGVPQSRTIDLSGERSRVFEVTVTLRQGVLRIRELELIQPRTSLLFTWAQNERYRLLYGGGVVENPVNTGNWAVNAIAATLGPVRSPKPSEVEDHDGIANASDNCPNVWNLDQADNDGDGRGNRCDNCVGLANPDQLDENRNGVGDVCEDADNDGIANAVDNCSKVYNPGQQDEDQDSIGDACDNIDSRFSADKPWLLWASMAGIIVILVGVGGVILGRGKGGD